MGIVQKEYRPLVKKAVSMGWTVDIRSKHPKLRSPSGLVLTLPSSSTNYRLYKWFVVQMRRNGVEL